MCHSLTAGSAMDYMAQPGKLKRAAIDIFFCVGEVDGGRGGEQLIAGRLRRICF